MKVAISAKLPKHYRPYNSTFRCLDLSRRCGRGGIWRRKWERLKQGGEEIGYYNKPLGCGTSVALATGPNDEEAVKFRPLYLLLRRANPIYAQKHTQKHSSVPKIYFSITFAVMYQNVAFTFILISCTYFPLYPFLICVHSLFYLLA